MVVCIGLLKLNCVTCTVTGYAVGSRMTVHGRSEHIPLFVHSSCYPCEYNHSVMQFLSPDSHKDATYSHSMQDIVALEFHWHNQVVESHHMTSSLLKGITKVIAKWIKNYMGFQFCECYKLCYIHLQRWLKESNKLTHDTMWHSPHWKFQMCHIGRELIHFSQHTLQMNLMQIDNSLPNIPQSIQLKSVYQMESVLKWSSKCKQQTCTLLQIIHREFLH